MLDTIEAVAASGNDPAFLYHYVPVADEKRAGYLRDTLLNHRIFLPSPNAFNDPFDCKAAFSFDGSDGEWRGAFAGMFERLFPNLTPDERAARVERAVDRAQHKDPKCQQAFLDELQGEIDAAGVVCFSEVPDNVLMWSHYADKHRGVCLKFVGDRFEKVIGEAQHVEYSDEFRLARVWDDPKLRLEYAVLTKAACWSYEKEWRLIRPGEAGSYLPFEPTSLSGLIVGCAMPQAERDRVRGWAAARSQPLELLEARKVPNVFALEIVPLVV